MPEEPKCSGWKFVEQFASRSSPPGLENSLSFDPLMEIKSGPLLRFVYNLSQLNYC